MSDNEESTEKSFCIDVAKQSRAMCKKCKQKLLAGEIRIAKLAPNPFGEGKMKNWHHPNCIFEQFLKQRVTTKRIECPDDLDGWDLISDDKQQAVIEMIEESNKNIAEKYNLKMKSPIKIEKNSKTPKTHEAKQSMEEKQMSQEKRKQVNSHRDNSFREFRRLVADITNVSAYLEKTAKVKEFLTKGSDKQSFKGDVKLWVRLLLPGVIKRIYNLQSRQLIKLFSRILNTNQDDMLEHLEQGDISETISYYFTQSKNVEIPKKSELSLHEIDEFLEELSNLTKEDDQIDHFRNILPKCTEIDLKTLIRLIKGDLRMNAGAKHILDGIHPDAYEVYKASKNIDTVLDRCLSKNHKTTNIKATISLLTPVQPMLAEACKSVEQAMAKCPNGMYSEIKYDGERVQIHKSGKEFKYFSRALKPVVPHKVSHLKDYISKAFPSGEDLILDSEILLVEHETGKPLPFGTLGVHKKSEFKDANVCLFVFDCIYYNGEDLMSKPLSFRKKVLKDNMIEIKNHVVFSEMEEINKIDDLRNMIAKTLQLGLEGLVLKDTKSIYEPGKRHWLKVKKDYLFDGAMADTADLIVLGAWYGTGKKGGMMSVFLMGCYDRNRDRFCTVTKVHTGHDDKTLEKLQSELDMVKTAEIPDWLLCSKPMVPDLLARDPKNQPVWEITGAEFTQHQVHTAKGISIRFPRVTRIRHDKTWKEATDLDELEKLMKESKSNTDYSTLLMGTASTSNSSLNSNLSKRKSDEGIESPPKKIQKKISGIFADIKLLCVSEAGEILQETIKKFEDNSGILLNSDSSKSATHILHDKDREIVMRNLDCPKTANHVIAEWVDDCITKNKLLSDREYRVILDSNLDRNDDSDEGFHS